jgi:23S rRNA pseudouridine2605 synthase
LHKPRGYLTSRRDPEGRPVVHDLLRRLPERVVPVGRLDLASSGLLLLTNDTRLADWITAPSSEVRRVYLVTVRGEVTEDQAARLRDGVVDRGEMLAAAEVTVRKRSRRESHLTVVLREGKNREVRRLLRAAGREVTRLKRVALGGLDLGDLPPGRWRRLSAEEIDRAFPGAAPRDPGGRRTTRGRPR